MADYFDPEIISRVKGLEMRSLRLVESFMVGIHKSRLRGISTEFAQHRQYVVGDDTKHLDWKVYAKTDRYFIKEYEAETNMPVYFFLDVSPSMFYKSEEAALSKFEYCATMIATLAYLLTQQKDTFGLVLFDEKPRTIMAPKGSGSHLRNAMTVMEQVEPAASGSMETKIGDALLAAAPTMKRKGVVVIMSDLVDEPDDMGRGLGQMSFMGQDLILFHMEDASERDFPFLGQTIFRGLENEGKLLCDPEDLREAYLQERREHLDKVRQICMRFAYEVRDLANDMRMDAALSAFLQARLVRRRRR
jgi:uncharacterized protein (DUF58 family)